MIIPRLQFVQIPISWILPRFDFGSDSKDDPSIWGGSNPKILDLAELPRITPWFEVALRQFSIFGLEIDRFAKDNPSIWSGPNPKILDLAELPRITPRFEVVQRQDLRFASEPLSFSSPSHIINFWNTKSETTSRHLIHSDNSSSLLLKWPQFWRLEVSWH